MIPIVEIAKGIFRIGPLESRTPNTNPASPFLVVGSQQSAIVEPGEDGQAPKLLEAIKEIGVGLDRIAYLIATHIHLHHVHGDRKADTLRTARAREDGGVDADPFAGNADRLQHEHDHRQRAAGNSRGADSCQQPHLSTSLGATGAG